MVDLAEQDMHHAVTRQRRNHNEPGQAHLG